MAEKYTEKYAHEDVDKWTQNKGLRTYEVAREISTAFCETIFTLEGYYFSCSYFGCAKYGFDFSGTFDTIQFVYPRKKTVIVWEYR